MPAQHEPIGVSGITADCCKDRELNYQVYSHSQRWLHH